MRTNLIPTMSASEFERTLSSAGDFLARSPCVIDGFIQQWSAYHRWKDLDYLAERFGHLPVNAGAPQFKTNKNMSICRVETTFDAYIQYVKEPAKARDLFGGKWVEGGIDQFEATGMPLYCGNMQFVRHAADPVLEEFRPLLPDPLEHWNDEIPYFYQVGNHFWLYVSLAGSTTSLHQDNNGVMAYLAQLKGVKKALLYRPEDREHYYRDGIGFLDPSNPDPEEFPTWEKARPWEGTLREGQMLLFGSNWAHHVVTGEDSISVSFDFVNETNLREYARSREWLNNLGGLVKRNREFFLQRMPADVFRDSISEQVDWMVGKRLVEHILRVAVHGEPDGRPRTIKERLLQYIQELPGATSSSG